MPSLKVIFTEKIPSLMVILTEFSITQLLGFFNDTEYKEASTIIKDFAFKILTVLLLYFNLSVKKYIAAKEYEGARVGAGWAAMIFCGLTLADVCARVRNSKVRVFDELAIISQYTVMWIIFYTMFEWASFVLAGCIVIVFLVKIWNVQSKKNLGLPLNNVPQPSDEMVELLGLLDRKDDITTAAILLLVLAPDHANTKALLEKIKIFRNRSG